VAASVTDAEAGDEASGGEEEYEREASIVSGPPPSS
jgi:hypothetical protein